MEETTMQKSEEDKKYPTIRVAFSNNPDRFVIEAKTRISKRLFKIIGENHDKLCPNLDNLEYFLIGIDSCSKEPLYASSLALSLPASNNLLTSINEMAEFVCVVHEIILRQACEMLRLNNIKKDMKSLFNCHEETNQPDPSESDIESQAIGL